MHEKTVEILRALLGVMVIPLVVGFEKSSVVVCVDAGLRVAREILNPKNFNADTFYTIF